MLHPGRGDWPAAGRPGLAPRRAVAGWPARGRRRRRRAERPGMLPGASWTRCTAVVVVVVVVALSSPLPSPPPPPPLLILRCPPPPPARALRGHDRRPPLAPIPYPAGHGDRDFARPSSSPARSSRIAAVTLVELKLKINQRAGGRRRVVPPNTNRLRPSR